MRLFSLVVLTALFMSGINVMAEDAPEKKAPETVHDFKLKSLEGEEVDMLKYKGKVLLVVNSECLWGNSSIRTAAGFAPKVFRKGPYCNGISMQPVWFSGTRQLKRHSRVLFEQVQR